MLGTLVAALEVRGVTVGSKGVTAAVAGENVLENGIPVLKRVHVTYTLNIPSGFEDKVDRALNSHAEKCPTALSLKGAVEVSWSVA
jgi:uncharacterized OsmC-like protein